MVRLPGGLRLPPRPLDRQADDPGAGADAALHAPAAGRLPGRPGEDHRPRPQQQARGYRGQGPAALEGPGDDPLPL